MVAEIKTVGVVGAGQMGAGIAQVCAAAGMNALLWDANSSALDRGLRGIKTQLAKQVEKGKITADTARATESRLCTCSNVTDFKSCDLVIEAIVENFDVKAKVLAEIDGVLPSHALLTSNTSSISITRLASTTRRADKFMGVHFMNPVPVMQLVELIKGLQTSSETYETIRTFVDRIGKTAVLGIDSPGFIVNRILCPMINEAIFLLQEGVKPEDIDNAMKLGTNQPMGPLTLADFVGLDTLLFILQILHRELGEDKYRPCPLLIKYVEAGWFGRKTGRGFYTYPTK
jgi:3-hydroxybutyryl-CoA dehydrogenase